MENSLIYFHLICSKTIKALKNFLQRSMSSFSGPTHVIFFPETISSILSSFCETDMSISYTLNSTMNVRSGRGGAGSA